MTSRLWIESDMMRVLRVLATVVVAVSVSAGLAAVHAQSPAPQQVVLAQAAKRAPAPRNLGTHVYLLRGFMDIFSTGMDDLGVKLNRRGIRATVHGHAEYPSLADGIVDRYRQGIRENVVIVGHSLGANAAFSMAEDLGKHNITVPLIIAYDPTSPMTASSNVTRVVNFYSSTNGWGVAVGRGSGFRGTLSNVDLSRRGEIGHTDIDKSPALHAQSISFIQSIGGGGGGGGGGASAATAAPKNDSPDKANEVKPESKGESTSATAAAKGASPESAASVPAAAKPASEKTETAASPAPASSSSN